MKKLLAFFLAMMMAFTCAAALAEETVLPTGTLSKIDLVADRDFVVSFAGSMDAEGTTTYADLAAAVLDILDKTSLYVNAGENGAVIDLDVGDTTLATFQCAMAEDGIVLVSNLFPSYALYVNMEELGKLIEANMNLSVNGVETSPEEMMAMAQELMGALEPYMNDLMAYIQTLGEKVEVSEDGTEMHLTLTTYEAADLLEIVLARLSTDEVLLPYVQQALAQSGEEVSVEEALAACQQQIEAWRTAEAQEVVDIAVYQNEDGSMTVQVDLSGMMLLNIDISEVDGAQVIDVLVLMSQQGTDDWNALYDGVNSGENTDDVVLDFRVKTYTDADDASDNVFVYAEVVTQGMDVIFSALNSTTGAGTADFYNFFSAGIDLGMTDDDIAGIEVHTIYADAPEAPSLEGLTVLNVLSMSEEEQNALMNDFSNNGLMPLVVAAQQAMPEQMAVVMQMLGAGE